MSYSRRLLLALVVLAVASTAQTIPTPQQYFGFAMGTDKKLARYDKIVAYFNEIAKNSDRIKVVNLGPTTNGNPFIVVEVSSAATMKNLDHYRELERELYFQDGAPTAAQQAEIFKDGKAVVVITNNIHSTEIGSSQMVVDAIYKLATDNSPATQHILNNVILLLVPSLNPDGQIMVTDWYNKYLGTPQEGGPLPFLYHPYVGHDDNRDVYLFSQKESRMTAQLLWHDWFPAIWLDEHQQGTSGPRMFTMPATDPINPNVDPLIYRLNTIYGQSQAAALESQGKTGIIFNATYTNYWEGAMAWAGWWHNEVGLLTEAASARIATPTVQRMADPSQSAPVAGPAAAGGRGSGRGGFGGDGGPNAPLPAPTDINSRTEYPRPWLGGKWSLKDIVDYETIATFDLLNNAANRREELLHNVYGINARTIEMGKAGTLGYGDRTKSYAAIIPVAGQHDANEVLDLIERLEVGGVVVDRAGAAFEQDGVQYPAGTFVIPFDQVFGRYAKDMLEQQTYPEVRRAPGAPAEAPYDVSAWSLGMQFGVNTTFARTPLTENADLTPLKSDPAFSIAAVQNGANWSFDYNGPESSVVVNRLLKAGADVTLSAPGVARTSATATQWTAATQGLTVTNDAVPNASGTSVNMTAAPRVGMYQSWTANMDEGWTRWVMDHYEFPYTTLHNSDIESGDLRAKFDAILLPDQDEASIINGNNSQSMPAEYRGGIGEKGWSALMAFVHQGGTLVAMGDATNLLVDRMALPVKELKHSLPTDQFFAPGTIVHLQADPTNPVAIGMAASTWAYYINTPFFEVEPGFSSQTVSIVARFPNADVNASGWLRGEQYMYGKAAVVAVDLHPGKVVLFGIRPQHRAQTRATMPMLFDALYWSAAR